MRRLLLLVAGGGLAFVAVAMLQEREVFLRPWFAAASVGPAPVAAEDRAQAEAAVRELLALLRHVHGSGGDPRFIERLPASEALRAEIRADAAYVRANGLQQVMDLVRLDVAGVEPAGSGRLTVATREYWQVHYMTVAGAPSSEPAHAEVAPGRYLVAREGRRMIVLDWEPGDAAARAEPAP